MKKTFPMLLGGLLAAGLRCLAGGPASDELQESSQVRTVGRLSRAGRGRKGNPGSSRILHGGLSKRGRQGHRFPLYRQRRGGRRRGQHNFWQSRDRGALCRTVRHEPRRQDGGHNRNDQVPRAWSRPRERSGPTHSIGRGDSGIDTDGASAAFLSSACAEALSLRCHRSTSKPAMS